MLGCLKNGTSIKNLQEMFQVNAFEDEEFSLEEVTKNCQILEEFNMLMDFREDHVSLAPFLHNYVDEVMNIPSKIKWFGFLCKFYIQ